MSMSAYAGYGRGLGGASIADRLGLWAPLPTADDYLDKAIIAESEGRQFTAEMYLRFALRATAK